MTNEELIAFVNGDLRRAALEHEEVRVAVCSLAGLLVRRDEGFREQFKEEMKPAPAWTDLDLVMLWTLYVIMLREAGGKQGIARRQTIKGWEQMTGRLIKDRYLNNLLSKSLLIIEEANLELPEIVLTAYKERREHGEKTHNRGSQ